ncbi:MAG: hypothetical protein U1C56_02485, partial [Candidatus Curtissbacteria bacterium]|nr:hypothetical protein [Candidatus Curtissbacteria bacterium]
KLKDYIEDKKELDEYVVKELEKLVSSTFRSKATKESNESNKKKTSDSSATSETSDSSRKKPKVAKLKRRTKH